MRGGFVLAPRQPWAKLNSKRTDIAHWRHIQEHATVRATILKQPKRTCAHKILVMRCAIRLLEILHPNSNVERVYKNASTYSLVPAVCVLLRHPSKFAFSRIEQSFQKGSIWNTWIYARSIYGSNQFASYKCLQKRSFHPQNGQTKTNITRSQTLWLIHLQWRVLKTDIFNKHHIQYCWFIQCLDC